MWEKSPVLTVRRANGVSQPFKDRSQMGNYRNPRYATRAERELEVEFKANGYAYANDAKRLVETILQGLALWGNWIVVYERNVRSRGVAKFRLKSMSMNAIYVILKPAGQDSAALCRLVPPGSLHPIDVHNRLYNWLKSQNQGDEEAEEEGQEEPEKVAAAKPEQPTPAPAPAPSQPPAAVPPPAQATPLAMTQQLPTGILGDLVSLEQQVKTLRFYREARAEVEKSLQALTEQNQLLELQLVENRQEVERLQAQLSETRVVPDEEFELAEQKWKKVEQAMQLLSSVLNPSG